MTNTILTSLKHRGIQVTEACLEWKSNPGELAFEWTLCVTAYGPTDAQALVHIEDALMTLRARINQEIGGIRAEKGNV